MSTLLLLTSLVVAAVPAARIARKRAVWNELRARPAAAGALLLVAAGAGVGLWWMAWRTPASALVVAGGLLVVVAILWWRARPAWGGRRRLPPGSLGLGDSLDAIADPRFYADRFRRWGPVFKTAQFHRPVVCLADLSLADRLLSADDLTLPRLPSWRVTPREHVSFLDDAEHPRHRAILREVLDGGAVSGARAAMADVVDARLQEMTAADEGRGVAPDPHLDRTVYAAMLQVLAGSVPDRASLDAIAADFRALGRPRWPRGVSPVGRPELERIVAWLHARAAESRDRLEAGGHTPPFVIGEILANDPTSLPDEVTLGNLVLVALVSFGNVRGTLGWVLAEALDHPEEVEELRRLPEDRAREAAADRFVYETLRRHQSEHIYRETAGPVEIGGYHVPRGWLLRVCVREAHDDPRVFDHPERFRPGRFAGRSYGARFRPFSDGTHSRFGAELAVATGAVFLIRLALGYEAAVVRDGPPERSGNRHWSHWRPSSDLRISLMRRDRP